MGKRKRKKKKTFKQWLAKTLFFVFTVFALVTFVQVLVFKFVNPPGTVNMVYEWAGKKYFNRPAPKNTYFWKDLEEISPFLQQAVLASEDQRFLSHRGFDFTEIQIVIASAVKGKGFRGASTISMQAARSLYLPASRSLLRKLAEAWYTLLIELCWDKRRILEVYLNTVDWGTGIVGAQAAALAHFSCSASSLTPCQAALMTAILPSPHKWSAKNPGAHVLKRQQRILKQMRDMPVL